MKKLFVLLIILTALFTGNLLQAVDLKEAQKIEVAVMKCDAQLKALLLPFGTKAGFPGTKPQGLENASYEKLYKTAAGSAAQGSMIIEKFIQTTKNMPYSLEFSSRYFMKRLQIAAYEYSDLSGNEKAFQHLCHEFAADCDRGFEELRFWAISEMLVFDNIWFKNIQEAFVPVKAKMEQAVIPDVVDPSQARETWKTAANALMEAGNAAGIASTKVGVGGLIGMPAWRLRLAIKYFKAAAKEAVVDMWHAKATDPQVWLQACNTLRKKIEIINTEMANFLAMHGGNPQEIRPVMYMMPATTAVNMADSNELIDIKASASDKGFNVETGENCITITGIADGPETAYDAFGLPYGDYARSVRFTLDIDKAPTTDAFGKTNYTKKNRRIFQVMTSKGATAEQVARALTKKVNDIRDFRAEVSVNSPESARIDFSHR